MSGLNAISAGCEKRVFQSHIITGDVVKVLKKQPLAWKFDVVIADPPYNIGKHFGNNDDKMPIDDYISWCGDWLAQCFRRLADNGIVYVYGFPEVLARLAVRYPIDEQRWLVWHYTNKAVPSSRFWQRSHEAILCLWKPGTRRPPLEIEQIREPYTPRFLKCAGKARNRTHGRYSNGAKKTSYNDNGGALPSDVLDVPALAGGAGRAERCFALLHGSFPLPDTIIPVQSPPMNDAPPTPLGFDSRRGLAMLSMVVSSVVISFGGLIIRSMEAALPWQINFHRSVALFGVVCGFMLLRYRGQAIAAVGGIGALGCLAGVLLGFAGMSFLQALTQTTVANTMFILGAIPFFAAILARVLLKEKLPMATLVTMLAAALGLAVMVFEGIAIGSGAGNGFALLTALLFASYAVILRSKRRKEMLPTLLISSVVIILVSVIVQGHDLAISLHDMILSFVWGGLLSGVANWMFIYASRHLAAAEVTLFMLLEFALAPLWVWLAINEQPSMWTIIGGLLIILAVAVRAVLELMGGRPVPFRSPSGPV